MKLIKIEKLHNDTHKYKAIFDNDGKMKTTKFGATGYEDYTIHRDEKRKQSYILRHKKDLSTHDPTKAGYLSFYILWNKPTLSESIADYRRRFHM
jgi:hypothetical protein